MQGFVLETALVLPALYPLWHAHETFEAAVNGPCEVTVHWLLWPHVEVHAREAANKINRCNSSVTIELYRHMAHWWHSYHTAR